MSDIQDLIHKTTMDCLARGRNEERERIIKLLEQMDWQIYWSVATDGTILETPTPKVLDRQKTIELIKGETKNV